MYMYKGWHTKICLVSPTPALAWVNTQRYRSKKLVSRLHETLYFLKLKKNKYLTGQSPDQKPKTKNLASQSPDQKPKTKNLASQSPDQKTKTKNLASQSPDQRPKTKNLVRLVVFDPCEPPSGIPK